MSGRRFDLVQQSESTVELAGSGCRLTFTDSKKESSRNVVQSLSHGCLSQDDRPRRWSAVLAVRT